MALLHEHRTIGQRQGHIERLLHDDHGLTGVAETFDHGQQVLDDDGSKAERELVDDEHLRVVHDHPGQRQHLLLPAAEVVGHRLGPLSEHWEQLECPF